MTVKMVPEFVARDELEHRCEQCGGAALLSLIWPETKWPGYGIDPGECSRCPEQLLHQRNCHTDKMRTVTLKGDRVRAGHFFARAGRALDLNVIKM